MNTVSGNSDYYLDSHLIGGPYLCYECEFLWGIYNSEKKCFEWKCKKGFEVTPTAKPVCQED